MKILVTAFFALSLSSCANTGFSGEVSGKTNADGTTELSGSVCVRVNTPSTAKVAPPSSSLANKCLEVQYWSGPPIEKNGPPVQIPLDGTASGLIPIPSGSIAQTQTIVDCGPEALGTGPGRINKNYSTYYQTITPTATGINMIYVVMIKAPNQASADTRAARFIAGQYQVGDDLPAYVTKLSLMTFERMSSGDIQVNLGVMDKFSLPSRNRVTQFRANWNGTSNYVDLSSLAQSPTLSGNWSYVSFQIRSQDLNQGTAPGVLFKNELDWTFKTLNMGSHYTGQFGFNFGYYL